MLAPNMNTQMQTTTALHTTSLPVSALSTRATPASYLDTQILNAARGCAELLQPPVRPLLFDVRLVADGMFARSNVPRTVYAYERTGYAWGGKPGPGAYELAINILNLFAPPCSDGRSSVQHRQGLASHLATDLTHAFAERFLTHAGDIVITAQIVHAWVQKMAPCSFSGKPIAK